jgi:hypothetical protein
VDVEEAPVLPQGLLLEHELDELLDVRPVLRHLGGRVAVAEDDDVHAVRGVAVVDDSLDGLGRGRAREAQDRE